MLILFYHLNLRCHALIELKIPLVERDQPMELRSEPFSDPLALTLSKLNKMLIRIPI